MSLTRDEAQEALDGIIANYLAPLAAGVDPVDSILELAAEVADRARREAFEEAALVCDGVRDDELGTDDKYALGADECAEAIRRLAKIGGPT